LKKITVVGAGNVGAATALKAAEKELAEEIILIDVLSGLPQGKALDLWESSPVESFDSRVTGTNDYKDTAGSNLVIITAGLPRKPGMSRDDLLIANRDIVKNVTENIVNYSPQSIIIVISNPLDAMTYVALKVSGFEKHRVLGMAGILDSARLRHFISEELNVSVKDVQALVLGGHGDSMVPLIRYTTISGIPISEFIGEKKLQKLIERTSNGGIEIVNLLKTGGAYYAPAASVIEMADAIAYNRNRILPCSAWLEGEYGLNNVYCGVPVMLGKNGIEKIVELNLNENELADLKKSAAGVAENIKKLKI
jgi:malate dehydrogenase